MELHGLNVLDAEVEDGLWNEDEGVFEHVQPSCLCLHIGLHTGLSRLGFEVVSWLNQVDTCSCVQQFHQDLELRARVFCLQLTQFGVSFERIRGHFGLEVDLNILLDLYDDISINGLSLIDGFVLVELQHNRDLAFVGHGQDEASGDVLVLDGVVESHAMESDGLGIEIHSVFSSGDCQVDVEEGGERLSCKLADLGSFYYLLIDGLYGSLLFLFLLLALNLLIHGFSFLLGLFDMEPDLAHAVIITHLISSSLHDDILFVDGGIVDG